MLVRPTCSLLNLAINKDNCAEKMLHICTIPISVNLSLIRYARARFFILNFKINFNETVKTEEMLILLNSKPGRMYIICKFLTIDF